jgi:hypothetical protein
MRLREFNNEGVAAAHSYIDSLRSGDVLPVPYELLEDDDLSVELPVSLRGLPNAFETRFDLALHLNRVLSEVLDSEKSDSIGLWTWLALRLFDVIAPPRAGGERKVGDRALYVLEPDNWRRYYRHLLAGPCKVMRAHWDELHVTRALLAGRPDVPGELYEQIASRQEVVTSRALVRLTQRLYWDATAKKLKAGSAGKGAGSARRLAALLLQLDLTWDFSDMTDEAMMALLPRREFARFVGITPA